MREIYLSTDVETDGPIPGPHSMLSFGSAAYTADKVLVSTFSANLETLPRAQAHPKTAEWWASQPEAWAACRKDLEPPEQAMARYVSWIQSLEGKPVFVAYPAGFDFLFVYWYLIRFVGESPFSHSALDIKSFAMAVLKRDFRQSTKRDRAGRSVLQHAARKPLCAIVNFRAEFRNVAAARSLRNTDSEAHGRWLRTIEPRCARAGYRHVAPGA